MIFIDLERQEITTVQKQSHQDLEILVGLSFG